MDVRRMYLKDLHLCVQAYNEKEAESFRERDAREARLASWLLSPHVGRGKRPPSVADLLGYNPAEPKQKPGKQYGLGGTVRFSPEWDEAHKTIWESKPNKDKK